MGQMEQFNCVNVYKQMTDVEFFVAYSNTWNHLTAGNQMISIS